jgi:hypothetical protein
MIRPGYRRNTTVAPSDFEVGYKILRVDYSQRSMPGPGNRVGTLYPVRPTHKQLLAAQHMFGSCTTYYQGTAKGLSPEELDAWFMLFSCYPPLPC